MVDLRRQYRPMLRTEWSTNITNAHQLQLMGAALNADYTLANNIDLTSSMNNAGDVWATNKGNAIGAGFYPVGDSYTGDSAPDGIEFVGSLMVRVIRLIIFISTAQQKATVGLFGSISR